MLEIEFVSSNVDCSWNNSDSTLSLLTSPFVLVLKDVFTCAFLSIIGLVIFFIFDMKLEIGLLHRDVYFVDLV